MDKYVKVRKIGDGAFGVAYLARSKEHAGRQVVLKEINMTKMVKKEKDEARKEVAVLAQMKHVNIVSYLDSFEDAGSLYIVMDFCDGGDLYTRINAQRGVPFAEEQILDWFVQMCLAVKHIHDRKILHRDIKSQNIFLTGRGRIKIGDFGIAKVLNSTVELARTCIGTPYYLSPEICDAKPYNNKSDIWSLGCVLYELTNLKHAFEAESMKQLVMKIVRGTYPPPSIKYSSDLRVLITEMFRKNPKDRPSVNTILKKPLLQTKIQKFLTELEIAEEFSHTVMHGVKIQKALPAAGGGLDPPRPLPPKPVAVAVRKPPTPSPSTPQRQAPRYNPASVYAPSSARNSKDANRKSSESRKSGGSGNGPSVRASGGSGNSRPSSAASNPPPSPSPILDVAKKRQEFLDKEKERREEIRKKQEAELEKKRQELLERQRLARMQKQREEGWKNVIGGSDEAGVLSPPPAVREVGNFNNHLNQFRQLEEKRGASPVNVISPVNQNQQVKVFFNPAQAAAAQGQLAGNAAAAAADRARLQQEFLQRRQEANANRVRAQGIFIGQNVYPKPQPFSVLGQHAGDRPNSAPSKPEEQKKDDEKESILARLRQIRQQNLAQHQVNVNVQSALVGVGGGVGIAAGNQLPGQNKLPVDALSEAEIRRKKIEAIKAQAADLKEKKLKEELERKRREGYEQEQKRLQMQVAGRPIGVPSLTPDLDKGAAIGLTAAMAVVGGSVQRSNSDIKKEKEDILKRINAKKNSDRPKWEEAVDPQSVLGSFDLEVTNALPVHPASGDNQSVGSKASSSTEAPSPPRQKWAAPRDTVVNVLRNAKISGTIGTTTATIGLVGADSASATDPVETTPEDIDDKTVKAGTHSDLIDKVELDDTEDSTSEEPRNSSGSTFDACANADNLASSGPQQKVPVPAAAAFVKTRDLVHGLSTGLYDIANVKLLRTCSEPDLSRFAKPVVVTNTGSSNNISASQLVSDAILADAKEPDESLNLSDIDSESLKADDTIISADDSTLNVDESSAAAADDDDVINTTELDTTCTNESDASGDDDDDDDNTWRESDDDDMQTMRASMAELLTKNDEDVLSGEEHPPSASLKTKKKKSTAKKGKTTKKGKKKTKASAISAVVWDEESAEELQVLKETMKSLLQPSVKGPAVATASPIKSGLSVIPEVSSVSGSSQTSESIKKQPSDNDLTVVSAMPNYSCAWESDDGSDDYFEDTTDMFSRIEEIRARLEKELGMDTCRSAYLAVQSLVESEEENSDEGVKQVTKILGPDRVIPYYQTILQLVMADGAFTEGND